MDFHGMKRKDLQIQCKKHGIPANLKNSEMASRLASVFEKETEEIVTETKKLPEDTVEADGIKDNLVVSREVKKVRFSPENEVFEFTRSVKKRKQKNVRSRSQGTAQDLQQSGIEVRWSTRIAAKGVTVAESSENEPNTRREIVETEKECSLLDATNVQKVPRRSKRIGSSGSTQEEDCKVTDLMALELFEDTDISKGLSGNNQDGFKLEKVERRSTWLIAKRSKGLVDNKNKEDELVKNNVKEVSMDFEVQETGKYHRKDVQDPAVENVPRRSRRFVNDIDVQTNTQDQRRSMRLKASAANPSMGGGTSDGRPLCSAKESKEERKTKQSKRSVAVNSQEGELVKNKTKEPLIDCMKVQDDSEVEKVPRRSKRLGNDVNLLMDKRPLVDENVKAVNHDDLEVEKAPQQSRQREKSVSELLVVDQAQKGDEQSKRTSGNDCEDEKLLRSSKRTALDNMRGQAMANSPKRCSVIDYERDGASVDNVKKLNVNDEMQVRVRFTRNSSRNGSCKAPIVVEGNLVEKKMDKTLDSLVKSSKKVAKKMKRDRSVEPGMDIETAFTQSNLTPEKLLDEYAQFEQKAGGANVEARVSSKKSKTMNQDCFKDEPEGMIEDSPSSSGTKAAKSVMIIENVLDSTLEKLVDGSQRTNTQELNSKLTEGEREEKLERDTVLMTLIEEEKEEVVSRSVHLIERVSPASVQLAVSNPDAELVVPTGQIVVKDTASTVIAEENTKTKDQTLTCTPKSELLQDNPQGMAEDSPSTETKATEPIMVVENVLDSTVKVSGDISSVRKTQECNSETMEGEHVEKNEQDTVLMAATTDKEEASTLCVSIIECSEVKTCPNNRSAGGYLSVETTPPPTSLQVAMSNPEAELGIPTGHILVKDIVSIVMTEEDTKTKDTLVCTPRTELKEHSSVANLAKAEVTLEHSGGCKEIHSNKDDEKGSLEKDLQAANSYGNFFDYNTEHSIAEEEMEISKVGCMSVGPCENLTPQKLFDVYTQLQPEEAWSPNVEARGSSKKMKTMNQEFEKEKPQGMAEDSPSTSETKATGPVMISENELDSTLKLSGDISLVRNKQESNSELMEEEPEEKQEQDTVLMAATEKDKEESSLLSVFLMERSEVSNPEAELFVETTPPPASVHLAVSNPEAELGVPTGHILVKDIDESAVFTTPERNLMLMEQLSEDGKRHAADSVTHQNDEAEESQVVVFTTPEQVLLLGDSGLDEAGKEEEHTATDFPDESDVLNITERYLMLGGSRQNEARNEGESRVVKLPDESNIATSPVRQYSVGDLKGDGIERKEENRTVLVPCDSGTCTSPARHVLLGNLVSDGAEDSGGGQGINRVDNSGILTSLERQLLYGETEQKEAVKTEEKAVAAFHDESAVPNIPERHPFPEDSELNEAAKSEENKAVNLRVDCGIFASTEKHPLFGDSGLDGTRKIRDNVAATCEESFVFTSPERRLLLGNSEPHNAGKQEQKEVEFKDDSSFFTRLESRLLLGESGQDRLDIGKSDLSHHASSPKAILKENSVVRGSHVAALEFTENTNIDSNGRTASKVSYSHEFNAGRETAGTEFMPKGSQAENVVGLDAIQGTKQSKRDSVDLFAFDIQEVETIIEAERNVSLSSYVLALPAKDNSCEELRNEDNSEKIGEISSHLEVAGTCSMVSEESGPSTDIQNHLNDALEELAIKGNNEANELIEAKITKNTQMGFEGNLLLDSSGNSFVSKKTCVLAGTEDEHLGFDSEVEFRNTCEKSGCKSLENEATDPTATAFEEAISLTPGEFTVQNNSNEEAADEEVIRRETTPSPEETINKSSENRKEYSNTYESGTLSEKQVRRKANLIYRTQVKPKKHDMKENAPNSKIVDNLNVTAPRTSKRKPLQDLRKN